MASGQGKADYSLLFRGNSEKDSKREKALNIAHAVREFEIDLYWKRSAYFWAILAVSFAGYFNCLKDGSEIGASFISNLGVVINLAWYLVNRGSARWQQNWEFHVDHLEDKITGPIYKTQFSNSIHKFWDIPGAYPFSPSRVNAIVSVFTFLFWLPLSLIAFKRVVVDTQITRFDALLVAGGDILALCACAALLWFGRARARANDRSMKFSTREYD